MRLKLVLHYVAMNILGGVAKKADILELVSPLGGNTRLVRIGKISLCFGLLVNLNEFIQGRIDGTQSSTGRSSISVRGTVDNA